MSFPTQAQWPPMPPFLADVQESEISNNRSVLFSMTGVAGIQQNAFYVNGKQFDPSCVDETMTLGIPRTTAASTCRPPRSARTEDGASQIVAPFRMARAGGNARAVSGAQSGGSHRL